MSGSLEWGGALGWAVEALVASTVLMVAVLALRGSARRAFGPDVGYALWSLPALRLLLPPLPASWHDAAVAPVLRATEQVTVLFVAPAVDPVIAPDLWMQMLPTLLPALALLWLVGAGVFALWHALAHHRFCVRTLAQSVDGDTIGGVRVIESAAVGGPLAFGVWRRYVAFPRDVAERYDAEERDLALAHELGHHARGDLIANWLALGVLALHWFNPVAWRAFRAFRADQEIANDARVLAGLSPMRRHAYACAIVKSAHPATFGAVSTACHLNTIDDLKGRLRMLTTNRVSRLRRVAGAASVTLLIGGGLGLTASGTAAVAAARDTVEQATRVELATLAQGAVVPVVPPAPAPPSAASPPPPPIPADTVKRRYKLVVTENGKTVSEHELPAPSAPGTSVRHLVIRAGDGQVASQGFGPGVLPPGASGAPRVMLFRRDGAGAFGRGTVPPMPIIENMRCSDGGDGRPVIHDEKDGRKRVIICTDRIERMTAQGTAQSAKGKDIERNAYATALASMRLSRARMTGSTDLTDDQRRAALDGMDTAIRELEEDLAKAK